MMPKPPPPQTIPDPPASPPGDWYWMQPPLDHSTVNLLRAMGYMIAQPTRPSETTDGQGT